MSTVSLSGSNGNMKAASWSRSWTMSAPLLASGSNRKKSTPGGTSANPSSHTRWTRACLTHSGLKAWLGW
ncbi:MAG: hypothetical protein QF570_11255 [Myxococcota bacterium]|nr:hypothetical protein [Myxococcota bacterium]